MDRFITKMVELLDCSDNITLRTAINSVDGWDSMTLVRFVAMAKKEYGKVIDWKKIGSAKTVADLYELVK